MNEEIEIDIYETDTGKCPFIQWESRLTRTIRAVVSARMARIRLGNFGDCKSIQGVRGIYELRIHLGPGFRIYLANRGTKVVILLCGGDKKSQKKDIQKAQEYWQEYLESQRGRK